MDFIGSIINDNNSALFFKCQNDSCKLKFAIIEDGDYNWVKYPPFCPNCEFPVNYIGTIRAKMKDATIEAIKILLNTLDDSSRLKILSDYCSPCGSKQPTGRSRCQCWNDE